MSENAIGYLLNRAGYHGHHVPHGFRAAFSTIMNEWAKEQGRPDDREVIDLMLAHVPATRSKELTIVRPTCRGDANSPKPGRRRCRRDCHRHLFSSPDLRKRCQITRPAVCPPPSRMISSSLRHGRFVPGPRYRYAAAGTSPKLAALPFKAVLNLVDPSDDLAFTPPGCET